MKFKFNSLQFKLLEDDFYQIIELDKTQDRVRCAEVVQELTKLITSSGISTQLIGFTRNGMNTSNPLAMDLKVLTPLYRQYFNFNKFKFKPKDNSLIQQRNIYGLNIYLEPDKYQIKFSEFEDLINKGTTFNCQIEDVNKNNVFLRVFEPPVNYTLYLMPIDNNTTEDDVDFLRRTTYSDKQFIFTQHLKKLDYRIKYLEDKYQISFNQYICNLKEILEKYTQVI